MLELLAKINLVNQKLEEIYGEGIGMDVDFNDPKICNKELVIKIGTKTSYAEFPFSRSKFVNEAPEEIVGILIKKSKTITDNFLEGLTQEDILGRVQMCLKGKEFISPASKVLKEEFLDLCVRYVVSIGNYNLYITKDVLNKFQITEEEIRVAAYKNLNKPGFCKAESLYDKLVNSGEITDNASYEEKEASGYIVETGERFGAVAILNKDFMKYFIKSLNVDFVFIIPSSVDEVIALLPDEHMSFEEQAEGYKQMCVEVNNTMVREKDLLSNNIYIVDKAGNIKQATK